MVRKPERAFLRYRSRGDGRALARVFDALAPRLLLLAAHVVSDRSQAEDLVQETFLRAMVSAESYDATRPLFPWLVGILHNEARKARRVSTRVPDPQRLDRVSADPGEQVESREMLHRLSDQVAALPETYRDVLNLRLIHGLQPVEIAHSLGRPPSTVSTQLQRGLARLRRTLPAGFGALLAASASGRGLQAVKKTVLAESGGTTAAMVGSLSLGGGVLIMKKVSIGVAVVGAAALIWLLLPEAHVPPAAGGPALVSEQAEPVATSLETQEIRPGSAALRQPLAPESVAKSSLLVRVRWTGGATAPGVGVRVDPQSGRDPRLHGREGMTGMDGTVRFDAVASGRARVSLDRGVQSECDLLPGQEVVVELLVPAGIDVRGLVVDTAGQPVPGAEVWVDPPARYSESVPAMVSPATVSDVYGRFTVPQLNPRAGLGARASGLGHSRIHSVPSDAELTLVIEGPGTDVRGRVVDGQGRPVTALVAFGDREIVNPARLPDGTWADFWQCFYTWTDAQGGFLAKGVPHRKLWVRAESSGYAPYEQRLDPGASELVIVLERAGRVFGTVTDPEGEPIAGATVLPSRRQIDLMTIVERMRTDARGRFELDSLPATRVTLLAHADGHARSQIELVFDGGSPIEWNPILTPLPVIRGTVLDEGGQPLAGASVLAEVEPRNDRVPMTIDSMHDYAVGQTDDRGHFSIAVANGKRYGLTMTEDGASIGVLLTGEPVSGGDEELVFRVPDGKRATAVIAGRLVGKRGDPLEGAWLQLGHREALRGVGRSEASGEFSIRLPPGRYEVRVSPRDPDEADMALGPFDLYPNQTLELGDVRPGPVGDLIFSYTCRDGSRIDKISAHLKSADGRTTEVLAANPDREATSRLPAGEYRLTVFGVGVVDVVDYPVTIVEGEVARVALELEPGVRRRLHFPVPIPEDWPTDGMARVIIRGTGAPEPRYDDRISMRRPMGLSPSLALGEYTLELILDDGRRYLGSFSIQDLQADQEPLEVQMHPLAP